MIPAIVLAAGTSTRMGRPKATLPLPGGGTFLTRIVHTFLEAGVDDVVVVVGHQAAAVVEAFAASGLAARFVDNLAYEQGQLTSLLAGLQVVDRPGVAAALVTLVDVPLVSSATVQRNSLRAAWLMPSETCASQTASAGTSELSGVSG